jgi:hypothetical protein
MPTPLSFADFVPAHTPSATDTAEVQMSQDIARKRREDKLRLNALKNQDLSQTMASDATAWAQNPAYAGKSFSQLPEEAKRHFGMDVYGQASAQSPAAFNSAQREVTGNPMVGVDPEKIPDGATYTVHPNGGGVTIMGGKEMNWEKPSQALLDQADEAGVEITDDQGKPRKSSEIRADLRKYRSYNGMLSPNEEKLVGRLNERFSASKEFRDATEMNLAYQTAKSQLNSGDKSGLAGIAAMEAFARVHNPGVSVRQGMMNILAGHQGVLGKLREDYLKGKITEGTFLTDETLRAMNDVLDRTYQARSKEFNRSVLQQFRNGLRPELQKYIKSPFPEDVEALSEGPKVITSQEEYDKLPAGAQYIANGKTYKKR